MKKTLIFLFFAFFTQLMFGQDLQSVSGVVTDADDNSPLAGVSVIVQGTAIGTVSDVDGKFTLSVPQGKSLVFSYIGYKQQVVNIKDNAFLNIVMEVDVQKLQEVVAIGYGVVKKSDLTGAVGSIKGDKLKTAPVSGVDKALQGRLAGVTVNNSSGQPGTDAIIRVRGVGTINNPDPIYVVDGVITDNIRFLSTSDIESLEVLKDASAQAIYGSRGANGVILITTKKGTAGKSNITFESYIGTQNRWNKLDVMKRDELANTLATFAGTKNYLDDNGLNAWAYRYKWSSTNTLYPRLQTTATPDGLDLMQIDTDWQDAVFVKDASIQNYYFSMDGGNDKSNYMVSANYFDQNGTIIGSSYKRLTLRLNTSYQMRKWLKVGQNLSFANSSNYNINGNAQSVGLLYSALSMAPWDPISYPQGTLSYGRTPADLSGKYSTPTLFPNVENPFNIAYNTKPWNQYIDIIGNAYMELTPIEGLTLRGDISTVFWNGTTRNFTPIQVSTYGGEDHTRVDASMGHTIQMKYEGTATYHKLFAEKHDLTLMFGATSEDMNYYIVNAGGLDLVNTDPRNWYVSQTPSGPYQIDATTTGWTRNGSDGVDKWRMVSFLGRVQYTFNNRYLLTASLRNDGSSKLPPGHFWGTFPSAAVAWKISEEGFFAPLTNIFSFMKIRAGWGLIGNVNSLGSTTTIGKVTTGEWFVGYPLGTPNVMNQGMSALTIPSGVIWEKSDQRDMGIDFGMFSNKLQTTVDLFERYTRNMIMPINPPSNVGYNMIPMGNAATVKNQGIELTLTHQNRIHNFNYSVSGNISYIKNKLTALNNATPLYTSPIILQTEGYPLNTIYVLQYAGVFKNQAEIDSYTWTDPQTGVAQKIQPDAKPGDAKYVDVNHDGQITDDDRINAGNPFPDFTYGLSGSLEWKGIDLQFFFQGVTGNKVYNYLRQNILESSGVNGIIGTDMRNVFFPVQDPDNPANWINGMDGSNGSIPNPTSSGSPNNSKASTRFVEDASYLRLKELQLGYTLPKKITSHVGIDRLRFYVSATNLLTVTKYTGYDPEVGNSGQDWGNYPQSRNLLFGLNLNF